MKPLGAPEPIHATDLFPDLERDVDKKISDSAERVESKIKNWVIAGVAANLISILGILLPAVFYLGQMSRDASVALATIQAQQVQLNNNEQWKARRILWEQAVEQYLVGKGFQPPRRMDAQD